MRLTATRSSVTSAGDAGPAEPWDPSDLGTNLKLWLDASDLTTLTISGSNVTQWDDKSGNGNHVTQAVASAQFETGTRTLNSLNVLDATASRNMVVANNFGDQNVIPICILGVVGFDTSGDNVTVADGDVSLSKRVLIRRRNTNKLALWTGSTFLEATQTVSSGDVILFTAIANAANSRISVNGNAPSAGSTGTQQGLTSEFKVAHADGFWGEVLIYVGTMSEDDQESAEGYFAHRWGLTAGLPSDHPYKSSAPTV